MSSYDYYYDVFGNQDKLRAFASQKGSVEAHWQNFLSEKVAEFRVGHLANFGRVLSTFFEKFVKSSEEKQGFLFVSSR